MTEGPFEAGANKQFGEPASPSEVAVVSIAISLKRIADALEYSPDKQNFYDLVNGLMHNTRGGP